MRHTLHGRLCTTVAAVLALSSAAWAGITIETVTVGHAGNPNDPGTGRLYGQVNYTYDIGKYEVTAGQYAAFLNAVGGVDSYGLYHTNMTSPFTGSGIGRSGGGTVESPYSYTVDPECVDRPVNWVSFGDAMRFANWLHHGQPSGRQDSSTTEDGAYSVNGATTNAALQAVSRKGDWRWAVANENEWYKAAYYDPGGGSYYSYPTSSNTAPGRDMGDPLGNNANYSTGSGPVPIDGMHFTTVGGEFENSASPYGTFDQAGNVLEWNETISMGAYRILRGGSSTSYDYQMQSQNRHFFELPTEENGLIGFRVVQVPEAASVALLGLGLGGMLILRRGAGR